MILVVFSNLNASVIHFCLCLLTVQLLCTHVAGVQSFKGMLTSDTSPSPGPLRVFCPRCDTSS